MWQIDTPLYEQLKAGQVLTVSMDADLHNLSVRQGYFPKSQGDAQS